MKHLTTKSEQKFQKVMHEFGQGKLKSHGEPVTDQRQALAIAYKAAREVYPNYGMKMSGGEIKDIAEKGVFYLDAIEGKEFPGYTFGDDWNGFEVPYFERPSANRIMEALGGTYKDGKYLFDDGYGGEEEYPKQTINTVDGPKEVFAIGAYSWVWSSPEKKSFKFYFKDQPSFTLQADSEEAADEMYRTLTTEEAAALGINSELYEGIEPEKIEEVPGIMKEGGGITPSHAAELAKIYNEGTAKQLWTAWTPKNRNHFLLDHAIEFFELMGDNFDKSSNSYSILSYDTLPSPIRKSVIIHHAQGMYRQGGPISAGGGGISDRLNELYKKYSEKDYWGTKAVKENKLKEWELALSKGDKNAEKFTKQDIIDTYEKMDRAGFDHMVNKIKTRIDEKNAKELKSGIRYDQKLSQDIYELFTGKSLKGMNNKQLQEYFDQTYGPQMSGGGGVEEIDLFEQYDQLPKNVKKLIDEYNERSEKEDKYKLASKMQKKFNAIGYDFEWGLDGEAFNLKKISSPTSMASGGEVYLDTYRRKYVLIDKRTQDPWANEFFATPEEAKEFAKQNKLKLIDKPELLQTGNFEYTSNKTLDDLIKSWSLGKGTTPKNEKMLQKMLADAKAEKSRRAEIKMDNGGPVPKKLSSAKQKLFDRIKTLKEAKSSANASAQKSIQKKIDILQKQFDYNPSAKERAMANKGKFAMDVPVKYSKGIYKKLWNMNIKPRVLELKGIASIVVNSQLNLEKAYQIYSDMLKEKGEKVPALSKISRKL